MRFLNPFSYLNALRAWLNPDARLTRPGYVEVPAKGPFMVVDGYVNAIQAGENIAYVGGEWLPLSPGEYLLTPGGKLARLEDGEDVPAAPPLTQAAALPLGLARRKPHPHVTSVAHAGYCLIVDAVKAFIRERLYEPSVVRLDRAAELVLCEYHVEQGWLPAGERHLLRERLPRLLGCDTVWDCPSFLVCGSEDAPKRSGPPPVPAGVRCAMSLPAGAQTPRVVIGRTVRPIDNVCVGEGVGSVHPVTKADVPTGQSLSDRAAALVRDTSDCKKFL